MRTRTDIAFLPDNFPTYFTVAWVQDDSHLDVSYINHFVINGFKPQPKCLERTRIANTYLIHII